MSFSCARLGTKRFFSRYFIIESFKNNLNWTFSSFNEVNTSTDSSVSIPL